MACFCPKGKVHGSDEKHASQSPQVASYHQIFILQLLFIIQLKFFGIRISVGSKHVNLLVPKPLAITLLPDLYTKAFFAPTATTLACI